MHDDADAFLEGSSGFEFSKNFAKADGGAIYNDGNLKMANSVKISENKVPYSLLVAGENLRAEANRKRA